MSRMTRHPEDIAKRNALIHGNDPRVAMLQDMREKFGRTCKCPKCGQRHIRLACKCGYCVALRDEGLADTRGYR